MSGGKVLGGSSSINGMVYMRGSPEDYNRWEKEGAIGWSYQDVLPYFLKSENNMNMTLTATSTYYHGTITPKQLNYYLHFSFFILETVQNQQTSKLKIYDHAC